MARHLNSYIGSFIEKLSNDGTVTGTMWERTLERFFTIIPLKYSIIPRNFTAPLSPSSIATQHHSLHRGISAELWKFPNRVNGKRVQKFNTLSPPNYHHNPQTINEFSCPDTWTTDCTPFILNFIILSLLNCPSKIPLNLFVMTTARLLYAHTQRVFDNPEYLRDRPRTTTKCIAGWFGELGFHCPTEIWNSSTDDPVSLVYLTNCDSFRVNLVFLMTVSGCFSVL